MNSKNEFIKMSLLYDDSDDDIDNSHYEDSMDGRLLVSSIYNAD